MTKRNRELELADTVFPEPIEASRETLRKERDRRAIKTGAVGVAVQVLNHGIRLVVIPMSIAMLGVEQYGLFLVVGSLVAWGGVTDLGLAPGLINVVATAQGRGDRDGMQRAISTAFAAYGVLAVVVALLAVGVSRWQGLPGLLGARTPELAESGRMLVLVCGLLFAASLVTRVVGTTLTALQYGYLASYSSTIGSVIGLILLFLVADRKNDVMAYALAVSGPTIAATAGLGFYWFRLVNRPLTPEFRLVDTTALRRLLRMGGPLAIQQISSAAFLYTANILIAARLGPGAVPGYSVPFSLFTAMNGGVWLLLSAYLPGLTEAFARGDRQWFRRRSRQILLAGMSMAACGSIFLSITGERIITVWTNHTIAVAPGLLWTLGIYSVAAIGSVVCNLILQSQGQVKSIAAIDGASGVLMIAGCYYALPALGLMGVPIVNSLGALGQTGIKGFLIAGSLYRARSKK